VKQDTPTKQVHSAVNDGWMRGGSFISSIIAGTLLGYFGDMWLGTEPWLVITGVVVGSYAGFVKMWQYIKEQDEKPVRDHR
jgi:F0F1-type ATP synthase assembly protein I